MMKKVAIVGAGPAGVLLAHYLLRRNEKYQVEIYDRRSDPRVVPFSKYRSYPVALFERGLISLRNIPGLEETIKAKGVEINASLVHQKNGKKSLIPRKKSLITIDRTSLVIAILDHLTQNYDSSRVNIHFNYQCDRVDFAAKTIYFKTENQESFVANYDLLVGADGARSVVRNHFLFNEGRFEFQQKYAPDEYKILFVPRTDLEADKIHGWRLDDGTRIIAVPQPGDTLSCTVVFNSKKNQIVGLSNKKEVLEFFKQNFSKFGKLISEEEAEAFLNRPISNVLIARCDRYHQGDSVIIIGDAAHALSPSLGQGCNSALEDVVIFDRLLDEYADNWAEALPKFTLRRVPDARAVQELSDYAVPTSNKGLFLQYLLRRQIAKIANKLFPQFCPPFFPDLLETTMPYSEILKSTQGWISVVKKSNQKLSETI
jgi:kynurenine 3-monooxygenase